MDVEEKNKIKNYETSSFSKYIKDINRIKHLDKDEELELYKKMNSTIDLNLKNHYKRLIVENNLRLVIKIASSYKNQNLSKMDLIQEGNIGLIRAVEKYDFNKGVNFSVYAYNWINQFIKRALSDKSRTIRIPNATSKNLFNLESTQFHLENKLGKKPSINELSKYLNISEKRINFMKGAKIQIDSLNELVNQETESEFFDIISDDKSKNPLEKIIETEDLNYIIKIIDNCLNEREKKIILERYGFNGSYPKPLREVSSEINLSGERVRQIEKECLIKLKKYMKK